MCQQAYASVLIDAKCHKHMCGLDSIAASSLSTCHCQSNWLRVVLPRMPSQWHPCCPLQAKAKIMVVRDVEREDIEFISKTLGCLPVAHIDHLTPEKLGHAELVEEVEVSDCGC